MEATEEEMDLLAKVSEECDSELRQRHDHHGEKGARDDAEEGVELDGSPGREPRPAPRCMAIKRVRGVFEIFSPFRTPRRVIVGPHWPMLCFTYMCLLVPTALFWYHILPYRGLVVIVLSVGVAAFALGSLTWVAFTDPGIVTETMSFPQGLALVRCFECDVQRPRSAAHCDDCDVCVLGLDHHCPWTGKCIGLWNLNAFYSFLCSIFVIMVWTMMITMTTALPKDSKGH